mgnify:CR=1 FL=1
MSAPTGAGITLDGQKYHEIKNNDIITISKAFEKFNLVEPLTSDFYDRLRGKLLWSGKVIA